MDGGKTMLSEPTIRAGQELFKWILIILAGIGVSMILVTYGSEIWDFVSGIPDAFRSNRKDKYADPEEAMRERRKQEVKRWKKKVKRHNRLRAKYELYYLDRRNRRKAIDAVANTLATHDEILKDMYRKAGFVNSAGRNINKNKEIRN